MTAGNGKEQLSGLKKAWYIRFIRKSTAAFTTHYAHTQTRKPKKPHKYIMRRELVERREAELPPPRTRGKGRKRHEDCH